MFFWAILELIEPRRHRISRLGFAPPGFCCSRVEQRSDVLEMERHQLAMETLGLSLADGKAILQGVQDFVTAQQVSEDLRRRRNCPNCGERYHRKEAGTHTVNSVFGPVPVPNPHWHRCSCQTDDPKTFRPTAAWLKGRTSPELRYLETKWGRRFRSRKWPIY
jgi:hypothetical protein